MSHLSRVLTAALTAGLALAGAGLAVAHDGPHAPKPAVVDSNPAPVALAVKLPDITITDQTGAQRRFVSDVIRDRVTLVHFFFTSCSSVCSPLTAIVKAARDELAQKGVANIQVVSISVDPLNDTPQRLDEYARRMGVAGPNWSLITGSRASTDALLKAFGIPPGGSLDDHTPMVFIGQEGGKRWTRAYGLAGPKAIVDRVRLSDAGHIRTLMARGDTPATRVLTQAAAASGSPATPDKPVPESMRAAIAQQAATAQPTQLGSRDAASYFTNLPVLTQDRGRVRFYDDLVRGRVVLVNAFFVQCRDVCSPVTFNLANAQKMLAKTPGIGPVQIVSLSVDPVADTPELLTEYARRHNALPGWSFVTGKKENVDWVLHKLGLYVPDKEQHQAALWIGNDRTNTWLKLHALATPEAIVAAVRKVAL